ncbi:MAG: DUF924 family protein [Oceanococcus sp.]
MTTSTADILHFWFEELSTQQWWVKDVELDKTIAERFGLVHAAAVACELFAWRASAQGRLAEIIVLDQFSRNIYRNHAKSFAQDALALALAQEAVAQGDDLKLSSQQRAFLYMPYMHSESEIIHRTAVALFSKPGMEGNLDFELRHKAIIDRFGRYPHRNSILGRESSVEEHAFLQQPGSSF